MRKPPATWRISMPRSSLAYSFIKFEQNFADARADGLVLGDFLLGLLWLAFAQIWLRRIDAGNRGLFGGKFRPASDSCRKPRQVLAASMDPAREQIDSRIKRQTQPRPAEPRQLLAASVDPARDKLAPPDRRRAQAASRIPTAVRLRLRPQRRRARWQRFLWPRPDRPTPRPSAAATICSSVIGSSAA